MSVCSCIYHSTPFPDPTLNTHELTFSLIFSSISTPLVYTQTIPSALSFLSPHLLFHSLKYGGGARRTHISEPPQSAQARAALGVAAVRPLLNAKLRC